MGYTFANFPASYMIWLIPLFNLWYQRRGMYVCKYACMYADIDQPHLFGKIRRTRQKNQRKKKLMLAHRVKLSE